MQNAERIEFRRIRNFSEVLDDTFAFIRQNFNTLFKSLLFIVGPLALLITAAKLFLESAFQIPSPPDFSDPGFLFAQVPWWIAYFLAVLVQSTLLYLVFYQYMMLYAERGSGGFQLEEIWQLVKRDFARLFSVQIGYFIFLILGVLLLIIPGVYIFVLLSIASTIRLFERLPFFATISRSRQLMAGHWWSTLGLLIVLYIICSVLNIVFQGPLLVLDLVDTFTGGTPEGLGAHPTLKVVCNIFAALGYFTYAPIFIGCIFQFFNLLERKEAAGLMDRVDNLAQSDAE